MFNSHRPDKSVWVGVFFSLFPRFLFFVWWFIKRSSHRTGVSKLNCQPGTGTGGEIGVQILQTVPHVSAVACQQGDIPWKGGNDVKSSRGTGNYRLGFDQGLGFQSCSVKLPFFGEIIFFLAVSSSTGRGVWPFCCQGHLPLCAQVRKAESLVTLWQISPLSPASLPDSQQLMRSVLESPDRCLDLWIIFSVACGSRANKSGFCKAAKAISPRSS